MNIALIAHDKKKNDLVTFVEKHQSFFAENQLFATGTTGSRIMEKTGMPVHRFKSGPLGGDQQIGSMISESKMDLIIFLRDPLTAQPHEPDVTALLRLCDVYAIPIATNLTSAKLFLTTLINHPEIDIPKTRKLNEDFRL